MINRFGLAICCFCWFLCSNIYSQVVQPSDIFTTHHGLPQIQVLDLMQDSRGYMWAGTKRGVGRFDGNKWESFAEARDLEVHTILENSQGEIILLPQKSGIGYFYKIHGEELTRSVDQVYDLNKYNCTFKNDTLFHVNVLKSTLQYFDLLSMKMIREEDFDISKYRMGSYSDKHGLVLVERSPTLERKYVRSSDLKEILVINAAKNFLHVGHLNSHSIADQKMDRIDLYSSNSFEKIAEVKTNNKRLIDAKVFLAEDFYYCDGDFNYKINPRSGSIEKLNLINTTRNIFLKDKDGNIWNSSEGGIQFFPNTNFVNNNDNRLNDAWFFQPYKDHYVYGNFSNGLKRIQFNPLKIERINYDVQNSIYFDPSLVGEKLYIPGSAYISIYENGKLDFVDIKSANTPLLCSFYDDFTNKVYFGGLQSLVELDMDHSFLLHTDAEDVFSRYILSIENLDEERLIIGSRNDLVLFDKNKHSFQSLNHLFPSVNESGGICIIKDNRKNIWIGNNNGLWHFDVSQNSIKKIGAGLIEQYVISLIQAQENLLAIGTNKELMYLDLESFYESKELIVKTFNNNNGFKGEEVGQNGFSLQDSILWIPSATKLVSTNVNNFQFDDSYTNVELKSINGQVLDRSKLNTDVYDLTYGTSDLEIKFNAIGFNLPSSNSFQYILEGKEKDWSPWTESLEANYRDLGSGEYTFKVRTKTGSKLNAIYPEKNIKLRVDLPFYKEPQFYKNALLLTLFLLGLIGVLLFVIYHRIVEKRELDKQFKLLQVQTLQLQLNPHFLFNVLGTIQSLILAKDFENSNKYLVSFSKMIRRYLDYNVSAYNSLKSNKKDAIKISLEEELDIIKIYLEFEKLQLEEKFNYTINIDENVDTNEIRIPPLIIQPLLENAIKHGVVPKQGQSKIEIQISREETGVLIQINDDGIGIARSAELQRESIKEFKSQSLELINQRIQVLNSMGENLSLKIIDVKDVGVEQIIFIGQKENQ